MLLMKKNVFLPTERITDIKIIAMGKDFVTVKTFAFPADTTIVRTYMEMRGIDVYMKNLTSNRLAYTLGDIEMQVKTSDFEKAKAALIEGGFSSPEDFTYI